MPKPWECKHCGNTNPADAYPNMRVRCKTPGCAASYYKRMPWLLYVKLTGQGCSLQDDTCKGELMIDHDGAHCFVRHSPPNGSGSRFTCGDCNRGILCRSHNIRNALEGYPHLPNTWDGF